jgi:branched-chain amino acid transport system permease protein
MATETPLEGDVYERRKQAVVDKLLLRDLALRHKLGVLGVVGLALLPAILTPAELNSFTPVLYVMMFAISWDVVSGYTGQLSFGHAFFFALGGYGSVVLTNEHLFDLFGQQARTLGPGTVAVVILAGVVGGTLLAAIGGVLIGVPALRLEGPYLSLVTLIAPLLLYQTFQIFSDGMPYVAPTELGVSAFTNSPAELVSTGTKSVVQVGARWEELLAAYYLSFLTLLIVLGVCYAVTRSSAGSVFTGIREDEDAVRSVGLNPAKFKIFAFVLSAAVGGFAAAMWMHTGVGYPDANSVFGPARIDVSIEVIIVAILGGMGTVVGAVVGALLLGITETIVGSLGWLTIPFTDLSVADTDPLPTFALGILVLVFMPEGVVPRATEAGRRYLARRRGEEVPDRGGSSAAESVISKYREEIENVLGRDNQ